MEHVFEVVMETDGCCEQLSCAPLETRFLCPVCKAAWDDGGGKSEATEMIGQSPETFLAYHQQAGTDPRFTCSQCGQLFRLQSANPIPVDVGQDHRCKIMALETTISENGMIYRNGDRENWIGFSTTTDVTGTVLMVRKFSFKGEDRTGMRMENLTVLSPWRLDEILGAV